VSTVPVAAHQLFAVSSAVSIVNCRRLLCSYIVNYRRCYSSSLPVHCHYRRQASSYLSVVIILRHRQPSSVVYCFQLCSPSSVAATVRRLRFRCAFVDITPCLGLRRMSIVVLLLCVSIVAMMTESVHL